MKNAHQRFGTLVYVRRTEKASTNIQVHLDGFIGEERGKAHFVSVIGGDVEIGAVAAALGNGDLFTVVDPALAEGIVSLGDKPLHASTRCRRQRQSLNPKITPREGKNPTLHRGEFATPPGQDRVST